MKIRITALLIHDRLFLRNQKEANKGKNGGGVFIFNKKNEILSKWHPSSNFTALFKITKKETKTQRKLQKAKKAYAKERNKQREHLNKELVGVNKLFEEGSISEDIQIRYKKMLEIGYAQKLRETREKYGFPNP